MTRFALPLALTLVLTTAAVQAAGRLELTLAAPKDTFVLGEPVAVLARLTNTGDEAIQAPRHLAPEFGAVAYDIAGADSRRYAPWAIKDPAEPFVMLAAGEVLEQSVDLFYGAAGWTFREPGRYEITATTAGADPSAPLPLTIAEPEDAAGREAAAELLASDEAGRFLLLRGGDHLREGIAVLEGIADRQADSTHAAYANVALGLNQLAPARDFATGRMRAANPELAADRLDRAQDQPLSLSMAVEAQLGLATALEDLGEGARAATIQERLPEVIEERFPTLDQEILRSVTIPSISQDLQR